MLKALAKERRLRYQSAAELLHDVECWLEGRPIVARSASSVYLLRKLAARHRYTATVVMLLLLIVLGFSCVCLELAVSERRARKEAQELTEDLAKEAVARIEENRFLTFAQFLQAWHQRDDVWTSITGTVLLADADPREKLALDFLRGNRQLEDEAAFRQSLASRDKAFAEFVIGEHHLRDGTLEDARAAYDAASQAMIETTEESPTRAQHWLNRWIMTRRNEVGTIEDKSRRSTTDTGGRLP